MNLSQSFSPVLQKEHVQYWPKVRSAIGQLKNIETLQYSLLNILLKMN